MQNIAELFPQSVVLLVQQPFKVGALYRIAETYLRSTTTDKLIWVTTDQPAEKVPEIFEEHGHNIAPHIARILFLDMVSAPAGIKKKIKIESLNLNFIENPNNMVEVTTTLSDLFADEAVKLAVIDSLNGIFAFNKIENVLRFVRFLPTIAYRTNTTILLVWYAEQFGSNIETALRTCADAVLIAGDKEIELITRTGREKIKIQ